MSAIDEPTTSTPAIEIVVGNPKAASRTRHVAEELGARVSEITGISPNPTIDLADHADEIFRWPSETMDELGDRVRGATIAIFASPTYKASYTGLLKGFLDRNPTDGLAGVTAIPIFTMGAPNHALAVEFTLRPLLVELGASLPTRGLSFETPRYDELDAILDGWIDRHRDVLGRLGV
ncbi:MAG: NADPH-dependent FMN reductase [Leucobacter sp.]